MPRTKVESTADAVEEQKTDAVEDTAPVQAEEPKAPAESEYTIEELADGAGNIFKVQRECVVAALKVAGVTTCTVSKAKELVDAFMKKEVKSDMAGTYVLGETKVRPGAYFNIQKKGTGQQSGTVSGVTAVLFRSDFGPLNTAVELNPDDGFANTFGNGGTTDAIQEAINGGAQTIIACRVGNGGTSATATLNTAEGQAAVKITAAYPGKKAFTVTVREKLTDSTLKECIIYAGVTEFEKVEFTAGAGEAKALADAFAATKKFKAEVQSGKDQAIVMNVSQNAFTPGTDPQVTNEDYSNGFVAVEPYEFNTICVDTEETAVHILMQSFMKRIFGVGSLTQGVVAEKHTVDLETRMSHAASFNDEKMNYVLNAYVNEQGKEIDGYQTAARLAGMIGACASNSSLTHTVVSGFSEILERLTNTQMIAAEKKGCIVLSYSSAKQVWIDNAINTLITPADNQDDGWKKIRRVKTRFELIRRMNAAADALVGKVDNDKDGRSTVVSQLQAIGDNMIAEGKLTAITVSESAVNVADGDSAWFDIDVVDKDSMEHIYLSYRF